MTEEPVGVLGVFALLLHQPRKRAPLVDGTAGVLDLQVENVEAFARGRWRTPLLPSGGAQRRKPQAVGWGLARLAAFRWTKGKFTG